MKTHPIEPQALEPLAATPETCDTLRIFPPTAEALEFIAANLCAADRAEIAAAHPNAAALDIINKGMELAFECYVATHDGIPVALFGLALVSSEVDTIGVPWMLTTDIRSEWRGDLHKIAAGFIARWRRWCDQLRNHVHENNTVSIAWIESLGFIVDPTVGANGFRTFTIEGCQHV